MQLIRLSKPINIAEIVGPKLGSDGMNMKSMQNVYICVVQKHYANMVISWVIECSTGEMLPQRTSRNFTQWPCSPGYLMNHYLVRIFPNPGSQKRITLPVESVFTNLFDARNCYIKNVQWWQHSFNCWMPFLDNSIATTWSIGDQPNKSASGLFIYTVNLHLKLPTVKFSGQGC
jgi:hypothetical protein